MAYSYFAFLDVMGYRYHLNKDKLAGTETFRDKLIASYRAFETIDIATLSHKSISDSIFMSSANDAYDFLATTKRVFLSFLENGLFVRGGVAYNKHFENQHITYSHALTDAYHIESSRAIFPRILLDKSVIEKLRNEQSPPTNNPALQQLIDNELILHCGNHYQLHIIDETNWERIYEYASSIFASAKDDIIDNPKLTAYHVWFQEYLFNFKPRRNRRKRYIAQFELVTS